MSTLRKVASDPGLAVAPSTGKREEMDIQPRDRASYIEDYLLCILFHLLFPLIPLALEFMVTAIVTGTGAIEEKSVVLVLAMYAVTTGVTSRNKLQFGIMMAIGVVSAVAFGIIAGLDAKNLPIEHARYIMSVSVIAIIMIFLSHAMERYRIHVKGREEFWTLR